MNILRTIMNWLAALAFLIIGSSNAAGYTIYGHAECQQPGWVPYEAEVKIFEVDPKPGGVFVMEEIQLPNTCKVGIDGEFQIQISEDIEGGYPDLVFVLTQNINNSVVTIYQENQSEPHWNMGDGSHVELQINSPLAVCYNSNLEFIPPHNGLLFIRVGNCSVAHIDCKGNDSESTGYYHPRRYITYFGENSDQPFGSALDLFGYLEQPGQCSIDYYTVEYQINGTLQWLQMQTNLSNMWYDTTDTDSSNWHWVSESMGPFSENVNGELHYLYRPPCKVQPNALYWAYPNRIVKFNTNLVPNELCRIRVRGFIYNTGGVLEQASNTIMPIDDNYGEIVLKIDNTLPIFGIQGIQLNENDQSPCDIIEFTSNDTIHVNFRVWDEEGHLGSYRLNAHYGSNQTVTPLPINAPLNQDNYGNWGTLPQYLWHGSQNYTLNYSSDDYTPAIMPTCAYQFSISVSKRTTNGYGLIFHDLVDTWHVTIKREE
jgi:hypothetical protein